jgi:penicillin G amidase
VRFPRRLGLALLVALLAGGAWGVFLTRRALPVVDGRVSVAGLKAPVEIVRDRWGVPHITAGSDDDAAFALGFVHAQDRLFQLELNRHAGQGRLAELFGARALDLDRLYRTMDFQGAARRMLAAARPEARSAADAYVRGVNAGVGALHGRLPVEFALLRRGFAPARSDDFVGVLGLMTWNLNLSFTFDPLYERLVAKVGPERAAELFPSRDGGTPAVHPREAHGPKFGFRLTPEEWALVDALPSLSASNDWVIGPTRSATGQALLANDPHLAHSLPGIWYEAQLRTPTLDVSGVTLPGLPFVVIGRNAEIAWGFTNVMQDAGDFFMEKLDPAHPGQVMYDNAWVPLRTRHELLRVRGGEDVAMDVAWTPHGPLVNHLLPGSKQPLAYSWVLHADTQANEIDGFYALDRARNWREFRAALSRFGAVAQNAVYADTAGHIGLQTTGAYPRLTGRSDGMAFRVGWDGSEEWDGFHDFEENPSSFDPAEGVLSSANNPTTPAPGPFYISSQWEPIDRITRIREVLASKDRLSVADMERLQSDTLWISARELTPLVYLAFAQKPPADPQVAEAVKLMRGWGGEMRADQPAPTLFAAFYRRLFYEIFEDELGSDLAKGYRSRANVSATMMRAVFDEPALAHWFDRAGTPEVEDRDAIVRAAFEKGVADLAARLGGDPSGWSWGRVHSLELRHPLGTASRLLGLYFNRGPFALPGSNSTVNKAEYGDADFRVVHGPSLRLIVDFSNPDASLSVLPGGESGIPASPHYDDQTKLWLAGRYHPWPLGKAAVDAIAAHRLTLVPAP